MDNVNLANAYVSGMKEDLNSTPHSFYLVAYELTFVLVSAAAYSDLTSIYQAGYSVGQVVSRASTLPPCLPHHYPLLAMSGISRRPNPTPPALQPRHPLLPPALLHVRPRLPPRCALPQLRVRAERADGLGAPISCRLLRVGDVLFGEL